MNWILSLQPAGLIPISPQSLKTIIYNSTANTLIPAKKKLTCRMTSQLFVVID